MKKIVIKIREDGMFMVRAHDGANVGDAVIAAVGLLMEVTKQEALSKTMAKRIAAKLNAYAEGKGNDKE